MSRFFNTAGPVHPGKHYCLPPLARIHIEQVRTLVQQEKPLVIFDRDPAKSWTQKVCRRVESCGGQAVTVWGM